jgi:glutamyl-Q tRNA(Asp) synthetase
VTGTIVTADSNPAAPTIAPAPTRRVGRFAPSPTGELHLGSLLAAVGSYLEARKNRGLWCLRMDDLDTARNVPGSADRILNTLELFGFQWDGPVVYQSDRAPRYRDALADLQRCGHVFACACTRRSLAGASESGCQQNCCLKALPPAGNALRFALPAAGPTLDFADALQGHQHIERAAFPDVIVRRRDGVFAYQLAVVIDDNDAGVTDVVRGADLLGSTPWQIGIQQALGLPRPRYLHLPLLTEPGGAKLSKTARSVPLDPGRAPTLLYRALQLLRQAPPASLEGSSLAEQWQWAEDAWSVHRLVGLTEVRLPELGTPGPL